MCAHKCTCATTQGNLSNLVSIDFSYSFNTQDILIAMYVVLGILGVRRHDQSPAHCMRYQTRARCEPHPQHFTHSLPFPPCDLSALRF